jgi:hypothetical protein
MEERVERLERLVEALTEQLVYSQAEILGLRHTLTYEQAQKFYATRKFEMDKYNDNKEFRRKLKGLAG